MPSNNFNFTSSTSFSSSSFSSSSSSSTNGQTTGVRHSTQSHSGPQGTTVSTSSQNLGGPVVQETRHYDNQGRELLGGPRAADTSRRIQDVEVEDVTEAEDAKQSEADKRYLEAMEDEYAKREGGA